MVVFGTWLARLAPVKPDSRAPGATDDVWLAPEGEERALQRFIKVLRERWWLVALVTVCTLAVAGTYVATAPRSYDASADLLVTPVGSQNELAFGLAVIRESSDPTRDVSTAARIVANAGVAARVKRRLRSPESPQKLLEQVSAVPVAQSSVVTVAARDDSPEAAAALANAFATESVNELTGQFHTQLDRIIGQLRARITQIGPEGVSQTDLPQRLSRYVALRGAPDPTLRVTTLAQPPTTAAAPRPLRTLIAALLAGLVLGIGAAFALESVDPRLRREEQLREIYRLPVLARVPRERRRKAEWLLPERLSGAALEAFRTLRAMLVVRQRDRSMSSSVLLTSSGPSEGKSTTALNLAYATAETGARVILLEADVYRPTLGAALGIRPRLGTESVLLRTATMEDALIETEKYGPNLRFLLAGGPGSAAGDPLSLPDARNLIAKAQELADYVIVDAPPMVDVGDVLTLATQATDVILVVRLGKSQVPRMRRLGELLGRHGVRPAGIVVVEVPDERTDSPYYYRGLDAGGSSGASGAAPGDRDAVAV